MKEEGVTKIQWDTPIPQELTDKWNAYFHELVRLSEYSHTWCVKPKDMDPEEEPTLILFSDGSGKAYGLAAYVWYKTLDKSYTSLSKQDLESLEPDMK